MRRVPFSAALFNLVFPHCLPTTRKSVLLLTASVTLPPCFLMKSRASSFVRLLSVPEITNVLPRRANSEPDGTSVWPWFGGSAGAL